MFTKKLSPRQRKAVELVAQDTLTDQDIARTVGVSKMSIEKWKRQPLFVEAVEKRVQTITDALLKKGIVEKQNRINVLNDCWYKLQQVIAERGASKEMQEVPGGKTGLLVHNIKIVGGGEYAQQIDTYEVDTGTLKEMRETAKQAAQELGQWVEKQQVTDTTVKTETYEITQRIIASPELTSIARRLSAALESAPGQDGGASDSQEVDVSPSSD